AERHRGGLQRQFLDGTPRRPMRMARRTSQEDSLRLLAPLPRHLHEARARGTHARRPTQRRTTRPKHNECLSHFPPVIASPQAACAAATMNENALHYAAVSAVIVASSPVFGVGAALLWKSIQEGGGYVSRTHAVCGR